VAVPVREMETAFVNRREELAECARLLNVARSGSPAVLELVAAAGMGKSALVQRTLEQAPRTATVLQLASHEKDHRATRGLWSLAHTLRNEQPYIDANISRLLLDTEGESSLRSNLGPALGGVLATAMGELSRSKLVLLVAEDVHWANRATLDLLGDLHVDMLERERARESCHLLLMLTRRPLEGDAQLTNLLDRYSRSEMTLRMELPPLDEADLVRLVMTLGYGRPDAHLMRLLAREIGGNPLEVREALSELEHAELLRREGDRVLLRAPNATLPRATLSERVERRIEALPDATRAALVVLALLVGGSEVSILARVLDRGESEVLDALEDGFHAGVLLGDPDTLRFAHPLYRRAVLAHTSSLARTRIHRRIAEVRLESLRGDASEAILSIGLHWVQSGGVTQPEREAEICTHGAEIAMRAGNYADSACLAERALAALDAGAGVDAAERARLQYLAGSAHFRNHEPAAAMPWLDRALEAARSASLTDLWCAVVLVRNRVHIAFEGDTGGRAENLELLEHLGESKPEVQARLRSDLSQLAFNVRDLKLGVQEGTEALHLAASTNDALASAVAEFSIGLCRMGRLELDLARSHFEASHRLAELRDDKWFVQWGLGRLPLLNLMAGRLDAALDGAERAERHGARIKDWSERSLAACSRVTTHALRGDSEAMEAAADQAEALLCRSQYLWTPSQLYFPLGTARATHGDREGAEQALQKLRASGRPGTRWLRIAIAVEFFDVERLARLVDTENPWHYEVTLFNLTQLCILAHAAKLLGARAFGESLFDPLCHQVDLGLVAPSNYPSTVLRATAAAATAAGRPEQARSILERACAESARIGAESDLARAEIELAELYAPQDPERAQEVLAAAITRARRMLLLPSLQRAGTLARSLGRTDLLLKDEPAAEGPDIPLERTLMVTDLVESTPLVLELGDRRWVEVRRDHDRLLRACVARHAGVEFAHTGDGIAISFGSAQTALRCAFDIQRAAADYRAQSGVRLQIRIGLAYGRPIPVEGGDLTGIAVNQVMRVTSKAAAGEIVVTHPVRERAEAAGMRAESLGAHALKGFSKPVGLYRIRP